MRVDLNSDLGESFGAWTMGDDEAMLGIITSASVACGWHAGDPVVMHRAAQLAKQNGVAIGAHPSFNDLWGFGRRVIRGTSMPDLEKMIAYQIGALQAIAAYAGTKVTHVKPHGALNNMAAENPDYALAIGRALKTVDRDLIYVALAGSEMEKAGRQLGLPVAREGFCDRQYEDDGNLASRKIPGTVLKDPQAVKDQVVRMVLEGEIISRHGKRIKCQVESLCVHGDEPTAIATARSAREGLEAAGVKVVPLTEMTFQ
jgi:5-oxoprolinase (ATP-hydrolysing) subunit A